ncbi:hypothetical protein PMAYCL1PPCAC_16022, partial [Pristionchus mayeri]
RLIPLHWTFLYVSYGPCTCLGSSWCYGGFAVILATTAISFVNVLICMGARLWILKHGSITRLRVWTTFLLGSGIPAIFVVIILVVSRVEDVVARELFTRAVSNETTGVVVTGENCFL